MKNNLPSPLIVAHRGFSARYPENTLAAFAAATDVGAHMLELDVTLSSDRQLVVIHDKSVDRTTNGHGTVKDLTLAQLTALDAGSWFDPRFCDQRIPTLAQVLDLAKGRLLVNIEIKPEAFERDAPADAVERQVLDLVAAKEMADEVLISSFEWQVLERIADQKSDIALGLLADVPMDDSLLHWYPRLNGFSWHPDYRVVTGEQVAAMQQLGARVFPYAVDGQIDSAGLLAMGVDGLILDDPRMTGGPS